jgi:hypothetical protein
VANDGGIPLSFEADVQQQPPALIYKYLSPERVGNVLGKRTVRFTPLMNTNDSFEIRLTFGKLAGPRFRSLLNNSIDTTINEALVDRLILEELARHGFRGISIKKAKEVLAKLLGGDFEAKLRSKVQGIVDKGLIPRLNKLDSIESILESSARRLLCFSLSERCDSAVMWAHYADDHKGFVVAFRSEDSFFRVRKNGKPLRLQKVKYFDGQIDELLSDPHAALISKTADWSYEREWRIYLEESDVDCIIGPPEDPIHLVSFPASAVERVIVGNKSNAELAQEVRKAVTENFPGVPIFKARVDRSAQAIVEHEI